MSAGGTRGPHQGQLVLSAGMPIESAHAAMIMVHGRGAAAQDILTLAAEFGAPDFAYLAPQAAGNTWYPYGFLSPIESNEPGISSGLTLLAELLERVQAAGIPAARTILLGFSQGACLTCEFAARNARRYGGVVALSGGLIGPDGTPRDYPESLEGTPIFMGCSDVDPHIPKERFLLTADVFRELGGEVTARLYPGMGHTVNRDEIEAVRGLLEEVKREA